MNVPSDQYNALLERKRKAESYLDNQDIPIVDRERWVPEFRKIISELDNIIDQLETEGYEVAEDEILGGIDVERYSDWLQRKNIQEQT